MSSTLLAGRVGHHRKISDAVIAVLCAAGAAGIAGLGLINNPRFFYTDDYQTYFLPLFREISRLVLDGHLPIITDRVWYGGAILAEYQPAVLNPVSVILYVLISMAPNAAAAAALFSLAHVALLAAGTYFLCRALHCHRQYATLAALVFPVSDWIIYWGAINWIPALVSLAWMVWAAGFLVCLHRDERWFVPAVIAVALFLTSGWPFALLAAAAAGTVIFLALFFAHGRFAKWENLRVGLAVLAGGLIAAPSLLPLMSYLTSSGRVIGSPIWIANLSSLTAFGLPLAQTEWQNFAPRVSVVPLPMIYVAWFIPIVLANADWNALRRNPVERCLLFLVVVFALLTVVPQLGQFRWMFRLLPYYHLALVVLTALICSRQAGGMLQWRLWPTLLAVAVPVLISTLQVPQLGWLYATSGMLVLVLAGATLALQSRWRLDWTVFAILSNIAVFWFVNSLSVRADYPVYPNRWVVPPELWSSRAEGPPVRRIALYSPLRYNDYGADFWRELQAGNTSLMSNAISVNGYTPFGIRSYREILCFNHIAAVGCEDIAERLVRPIGETGRNLLDLMRIEQVIVMKPEMAARLQAKIGSAWSSAPRPGGATLFQRHLPADAPPDPVSWQASGTSSEVIDQSPQRIALNVTNQSDEAAQLVFARAWYPGWEAELDGRPVKVDSQDDLLLRVELPARSAGRLQLVYWPASFWPGMWLAAVGLCLVLALAFRKPLTSVVSRR